MRLAIVLATGSAADLAELETRAKARKLTISAATLLKAGIDLSSEQSIYKALGMRWIAPELREGRGETAAAAKRRLPSLVTVKDLRGDLHMHTTASHGANSIEQMAAAAQEHGYEYIAFTDHSQSLRITN
jgi:DNA polymerase (family 10)